MTNENDTNTVDDWIALARLYLRTEGVIPAPMIDSITDIAIHNPREGLYFFRTIRRYPALKKTLMVYFTPTDDQPAFDEPPAFMDHPGSQKRITPGQVHSDLMFR
jgi:hypothetical protein